MPLIYIHPAPTEDLVPLLTKYRATELTQLTIVAGFIHSSRLLTGTRTTQDLKILTWGHLETDNVARVCKYWVGSE